MKDNYNVNTEREVHEVLVDFTQFITPELVERVFPRAKREDIQEHLPNVLESLRKYKLTDPDMIAMALGTIKAESAGFRPITEYVSEYNTENEPFDKYEGRRDLGNIYKYDGGTFRGRGFVQLTGRANYKKYGNLLGINLIERPDLANNSEIASDILALFLKRKSHKIRKSIKRKDLRRARRTVNGGVHGLERFKKAYKTIHRSLKYRFTRALKNGEKIRERI